MPLPHFLTDNLARNLVIGTLIGVANSAGGSAGAAVTTAVTFTDQFSNGQLPANYTAYVMPSQSCLATINGRTASGFNVVLTPCPATATLAAGTFDVTVVGL
jgi:hypothetical protein